MCLCSRTFETCHQFKIMFICMILLNMLILLLKDPEWNITKEESVNDYLHLPFLPSVHPSHPDHPSLGGPWSPWPPVIQGLQGFLQAQLGQGDCKLAGTSGW